MLIWLITNRYGFTLTALTGHRRAEHILVRYRWLQFQRHGDIRLLKTRQSKLPIRWKDLPFRALELKVQKRVTGTVEHAHEDALGRILRHSLPNGRLADHLRYLEVHAEQMVRRLRATRDVLREYLLDRGARPAEEVHRVVFELAVVPVAVQAVRDAATDYVCASCMPAVLFRRLCGDFVPVSVHAETTRAADVLGLLGFTTRRRVATVMNLLVDESSLQSLAIKPDALTYFFGTQRRLLLRIEENPELWKGCSPWSEVLAGLFHAAQDELHFQAEELLNGEPRLLHRHLTELERLVCQHLYQMRTDNGSTTTRKFDDSLWLALMADLDRAKVPLQSTLDPKAREALNAIRRRGENIRTWVEAYKCRSAVRLFPRDDSIARAQPFTLKRLATKTLMNIERRMKAEFKSATVHS